MSGKSRYGGGFGSSSRYYATDTTAEKNGSAAVTTTATDTVQASWAQYVQNLVSERIVAIHDGVIAGVGAAINEQLDHLFDKANEFLRRELNTNSAKVEAALADIRAVKAEIREKIRAELRAEIRTEIADRMTLIKQLGVQGTGNSTTTPFACRLSCSTARTGRSWNCGRCTSSSRTSGGARVNNRSSSISERGGAPNFAPAG